MLPQLATFRLPSSTAATVATIAIAGATGATLVWLWSDLLPDGEYCRRFLIDDWLYRNSRMVLDETTSRRAGEVSDGGNGVIPEEEDETSPLVSSIIYHSEHLKVRPSWVDKNFHMNNARYIYELNFSRRQAFHNFGLWAFCRRRNLNLLVTSQTIRYRRELRLGEVFRLETRIVDWADSAKSFFVETRFVSVAEGDHDVGGFILAIHMTKYRIVGPRHSPIATPSEMLHAVGLLSSKELSIHVLFEERMKEPNSFLTLWEKGNEISSAELNPRRK